MDGKPPPQGRRQAEPPTNQHSLTRPNRVLAATNNTTATQSLLDQQEKQANERRCLEFAQLASNDAYMDEKHRIIELHQQQGGFRDEKAAIISHMRTADGGRPLGRDAEGEPTEQQSIIVPSRPSDVARPWTRLRRKGLQANNTTQAPDSIPQHQVRPGAVQQNYPAFYRLPAWANQRMRRQRHQQVAIVPTFNDSPRITTQQEERAETNTTVDANAPVVEAMVELSQPARSTNADDEREERSKRVNRIVIISAFGFVLLTLAVGFSVGMGFTASLQEEMSLSNNNTDLCEIDFSSICRQTGVNATFVVPNCSEIPSRYQTLAAEFLNKESLSLANMTNSKHKMVPQPCKPSSLALLSLATVATTGTSTANTQQYKRDYYALATLYFSTRGSNWNLNHNWLEDPDICKWFGIKCSPNSTTVLGINLSRNKLVGSLPSEIAWLMNLTSLVLNNNMRLQGSIPTEIGRMQQLTSLSLLRTNIESDVPPEIGNCSQLQSLEIQSDILSGSIPTELGKLRHSLKRLNLETASLTGTIPTELGTLNKLTFLSLFMNQVSGIFPSEIGNLISLETLWAKGALLEGTEFLSHLLRLSNLTALTLVELNIATTLPSTISQLSSLEILQMQGNFLRGTLPTEMGLMGNLGALLFSGQDITGQIPTELGRLTQLTSLHIHDTKVTGNIPSELGRLSDLESFNIASNKLSGTLPPELCPLKSIPVFLFDDGFGSAGGGSVGSFVVDECE